MWEAEEGRGRVERVGKGLLHLHETRRGRVSSKAMIIFKGNSQEKKKKRKKLTSRHNIAQIFQLATKTLECA